LFGVCVCSAVRGVTSQTTFPTTEKIFRRCCGMAKAVLVLVLVVCATAVAERVSYAGHRVVDVKLQTAEELAWLASLPEETDGVRGVDVWSNDGVLTLGLNTVRLTPAGFAALAASSIGYTVRVEDLEARDKLIDAQPAAPLPPSDVTVYDPVDPWCAFPYPKYRPSLPDGRNTSTGSRGRGTLTMRSTTS